METANQAEHADTSYPSIQSSCAMCQMFHPAAHRKKVGTDHFIQRPSVAAAVKTYQRANTHQSACYGRLLRLTNIHKGGGGEQF